MADRCVITIGNFDGVHAGHRAILARGRAVADGARLPLVALTFDPHPATVLRPGHAPPRLSTRDQRIALLRAAGADDVVILEPTAALLALTPEQFVKRLLDEHRPHAIIEGPDFRFGRDRAGDVGTLKQLGAKFGFDVCVVAPVGVRLCDQLVAPVRSSLVRWLLAGGRVADAARCLGRWYSLGGPVIEGEKRGRTLGVPTINLGVWADGPRQLPADAVYAGVAVLPGGGQHPAAISVGVKPTFAGQDRAVEAHLLDFDADLYGQPVELRFARWLRDQQPFPTVDALKAQLGRDIAETRRLHTLGLLVPPADIARPSRSGCGEAAVGLR